MKVKRFEVILVILFSLLVAGAIYYKAQLQPQNDLQVRLYKHQQDQVIVVDLEEYIKGTVAAEMPASFAQEALKAQAVCARTYAVKKLITNPPYPQGAELSDDISTCQAFVSQDEFLSSHGDNPELWDSISHAVETTRGEVMLFDDEPIDALYCSTCGGYTEDPREVWGGSIPYLKVVKCGYCQQSDHYSDEMVVKNETLKKMINVEGQSLKIRIESRTRGGRPNIISINGKKLEATELRKNIGLPSSWMEFEVRKDSTLIRTHGYGHGVGLCQYGANGMAQAGKNYHQILQHYYQGISFYNLDY